MRQLKRQNRHRHHRQRRGLTLVELVVAFTLLVGGLVPVFRVLTLAHATSRRVEATSRSLALAQGLLNKLRAQSATNYYQTFDGESLDQGDGYLATVKDDRAQELREVTVWVGRDENHDTQLSEAEVQVRLRTYIAFMGDGKS